MTPEIIARVDAWLASRSLDVFRDAWAGLANRCLYYSKRRDEAEAIELAIVEASMQGLLIALVRQAWDDPSIVAAIFAAVQGRDDDGNPMGPRLFVWGVTAYDEARLAEAELEPAQTELDALTTALEAAP